MPRTYPTRSVNTGQIGPSAIPIRFLIALARHSTDPFMGVSAVICSSSTLNAMLIPFIIVGTFYLAREVLLPIALACILSFMLAPPVRMLQNRRVPRGLAVAAVVLLAFFVI